MMLTEKYYRTVMTKVFPRNEKRSNTLSDGVRIESRGHNCKGSRGGGSLDP